MKKFLSIALSAIIAASTLVMGVSAHKDFKSWGDVPYTKAPITVDGKLDEIYKKGLVVDVSTRTDGITGGATGKAYLIHDGKNIYCFLDVTDPDICAIDATRVASASWTNEALELTYDWKNDGTTRYKWINYYDGTIFKAGDAAKNTDAACESKGSVSATGWTVETKVALVDYVSTKSSVGIQICIDDMTDGLKTRGIIRSVQSGGAGDNDVKKFDYVVLSATEVALDAPKTTTTTKTPATAAQTADAAALVVAIAALSAAGLVALRKKSR